MYIVQVNFSQLFMKTLYHPCRANICVDNVRWLDNDLNPFFYIDFLKYFFGTATTAAPQIQLYRKMLVSNPLSTLILWENPFNIVAI